MIHIKTILHPTDFSESAQQAQFVAQLLARDHGAKLVLVHVTTPFGSEGDPFARQVEHLTRVELAGQRLATAAKQCPGLVAETHVLCGEPGTTIIDAAQTCHADLIVMGTHGESGLGRFLLGSVAEHVVRHAPCAVLTLRPGAGWGLSQEAEQVPQDERFAFTM